MRTRRSHGAQRASGRPRSAARGDACAPGPGERGSERPPVAPRAPLGPATRWREERRKGKPRCARAGPQGPRRWGGGARPRCDDGRGTLGRPGTPTLGATPSGVALAAPGRWKEGSEGRQRQAAGRGGRSHSRAGEAHARFGLRPGTRGGGGLAKAAGKCWAGTGLTRVAPVSCACVSRFCPHRAPHKQHRLGVKRPRQGVPAVRGQSLGAIC